MITGKDVYTAFLASWPHNEGKHPTWGNQGEDVQATYEAMAAQINEQFIAPLQGVVRDYQQFVDSGHYIRTLVYAPKDARQLSDRAKALLGEEPPQ